MGKTIDGKYLKGLKYTGSTEKKFKEDGQTRIQHQAFERELRPADVLDYRLRAKGLVVVAADGQKHTIKLSAAERKELEAAEAAESGETK